MSDLDDVLRDAIPAAAPQPYGWVAQPLTSQAIRALIEKIRNEPFPPVHGTERNPHLFSPVRTSFWYDHCIECGMEMDLRP